MLTPARDRWCLTLGVVKTTPNATATAPSCIRLTFLPHRLSRTFRAAADCFGAIFTADEWVGALGFDGVQTDSDRRLEGERIDAPRCEACGVSGRTTHTFDPPRKLRMGGFPSAFLELLLIRLKGPNVEARRVSAATHVIEGPQQTRLESAATTPDEHFVNYWWGHRLLQLFHQLGFSCMALVEVPGLPILELHWA